MGTPLGNSAQPGGRIEPGKGAVFVQGPPNPEEGPTKKRWCLSWGEEGAGSWLDCMDR